MRYSQQMAPKIFPTMPDAIEAIERMTAKKMENYGEAYAYVVSDFVPSRTDASTEARDYGVATVHRSTGLVRSETYVLKVWTGGFVVVHRRPHNSNHGQYDYKTFRCPGWAYGCPFIHDVPTPHDTSVEVIEAMTAQFYAKIVGDDARGLDGWADWSTTPPWRQAIERYSDESFRASLKSKMV